VFLGDPYRYLRIIAAFTRTAWTEPRPPCAILDPLLANRAVPCI
jgi:hypothetical protein